MKRTLFAVFLMASSAAHAEETVKACGHHDYAPWNWVKDGKIVGICAEITEKVFAEIGYKVDLNYNSPWARCQLDVKSGNIDINICSFKNPDRESYSTFTTVPLGINTTSVFVKKGNEFPFKTLQDLKGKTVGLVQGVSMGPEFDTFINENTRVERVSTEELNFKKLASDRVDAILTGLSWGQARAAVLGLENSVTALPTPIAEGTLLISVSKNSPLSSKISQID